MPTSEEFVARVQELTSGTPYTVTPTAGGCDITLDLPNAQWHTLMAQQSLQRVFVFSVALDPAAGRLSVTDRTKTVQWSAGADGSERVPTLSGSISATSGRVIEVSRQQIHAWGSDGSYGPQVDYALDSREGHALIDKVATEQGWDQQMPTRMKIGVVVAIGGVVLALVIGVILLITLL